MFGTNHIFLNRESGPEYVREFVKRFRAKIDAAELWASWYPEISIKGLGKFCINKHAGCPGDGFDYGVVSYLRHGNNCGNSWPNWRCREALKIMNE